jgi:hypothetical protein
MKQTLETAAKENILFNHRTVDRTLSGKDLAQFGEINFIQGAEWHAKQPLWISVEERLPEKPEYDWVLVIVRDKRDGFIGIPQIGELRSDGFWHTVTSDSFNTPDFRRIYNTTDALGEILKQEVVAWMPIPSFDEILEANRDVLERIKEKGD